MRPYSVYQCLSSVGFLLMIAHTQSYQEIHWPEGRVVYVHPWLLLLAYTTGAMAMVFGVCGVKNTGLAERLNAVMPRVAALLLAIMVLMALFLPGPYAP